MRICKKNAYGRSISTDKKKIQREKKKPFSWNIQQMLLIIKGYEKDCKRDATELIRCEIELLKPC